jgi:hypothetical protein
MGSVINAPVRDITANSGDRSAGDWISRTSSFDSGRSLIDGERPVALT